jgi:hypothetical protein
MLAAAGLSLFGLTGSIAAEVYMNEIFFDPPSSGDSSQEYVELRGTADMMLDDHYLIFLENENLSNNSGMPGVIDFIFDLNGLSLSNTGFLTLRQKGTPYSLPAGPHDLINSGTGDSWGTSPADNNVGVTSIDGEIENSGFTAMLIRRESGAAPSLNLELDGHVDNDGVEETNYDGLDHLVTGGEHWQIINPDSETGYSWTVLDAIGVYSEEHEAVFGRTYAPINFGVEFDGEQVIYFEQATLQLINQVFHPNIAEGQTYVGVGAEIESVHRYGNSTGSTEHDWHATNVTNNTAAGFVSADEGFLQSGPDPHGLPRQDGLEYESSQFVPYGTNITDTLGTPNYPLNQTSLPWDFNGNGVVDAADYTVWRDSLGQTDPTGTSLAANADRDGSVDQTDYLAWKYHFGESLPNVGAGSLAGRLAVPEPATGAFVMLAAVVMLGSRRRR